MKSDGSGKLPFPAMNLVKQVLHSNPSEIADLTTPPGSMDEVPDDRKGFHDNSGRSIEAVRVWLGLRLSVANLHSTVWPPEVRNPSQ